jgi:hypothetical protein
VARKQIDLATCGLWQNVGVTIDAKHDVWILQGFVQTMHGLFPHTSLAIMAAASF